MSRFLAFLCTVLLMLGAGIVLGRLSSRMPAAAPKPPTTGPAWFDEQLNLSPGQRKQMDAIWGETRQKMEKLFDRQRALDTERENAIKELLSEEQRAKYDAIRQSYREKRGEFDQDFQKLRKEGDEKSRALLDENQLKRWDQLQKAREGRHRGGSRSRGPSTQRSTTESSRPPAPPPDGIAPGPR
jgi:hypothetical protein